MWFGSESLIKSGLQKLCTGGRAGLMRRIANPVYIRACVSCGRSPVRTLICRHNPNW